MSEWIPNKRSNICLTCIVNVLCFIKKLFSFVFLLTGMNKVNLSTKGHKIYTFIHSKLFKHAYFTPSPYCSDTRKRQSVHFICVNLHAPADLLLWGRLHWSTTISFLRLNWEHHTSWLGKQSEKDALSSIYKIALNSFNTTAHMQIFWPPSYSNRACLSAAVTAIH